tara:strand:- start:935 stop:1354 length:420 start_codon:yes stop_codon:yes gene_type:complete
MKMKELEVLAALALPFGDQDWGSERQVDAETKFFEAIQRILPDREWDELEEYCLKATTKEMVACALKYVTHHWDTPAPVECDIEGTDEQRKSYAKIVERWETVEKPQRGVGMDCWMVKVTGETGMTMWLGIEPDGYTHS